MPLNILLTPSKYEDLLARNYLFALRCLGDQMPVSDTTTNTLVERVTNERLYRIGPAQYQRYRQALNERLEYLRGSKTASLLISRLLPIVKDKDQNKDVRIRVVNSLLALGKNNSNVVKALLHILVQDTSADVRGAAALSLGQVGVGMPEVSRVLLEVGQHDVSERVRWNAAIILIQHASEMINRDEIILVLLEELKSSSDWSTRQDAARFIGRLGNGDEQNLRALYQGLLDEDNDVRTACVQGLVVLARRFPNVYQKVEKMFMQAIKQKKFDKQDNTKRSAHDYAYDGLWLLVVGGEINDEDE